MSWAADYNERVAATAAADAHFHITCALMKEGKEEGVQRGGGPIEAGGLRPRDGARVVQCYFGIYSSACEDDDAPSFL